MSENLDLVRSIHPATKSGDMKPTAWAHPDIELVFADGPRPGTWTGVAGLTEGWRDYVGAFQGYYSERLS